MEKNEKQSVTIYNDGRLEVISNKGYCLDNVQSCAIEGEFSINAESVRNLMLQHKTNGGFKKIHVSYDGESRDGYFRYIYVDSLTEEVIKKLEEEIDFLKNENYKLKDDYYNLFNKSNCYLSYIRKLKDKIMKHNYRLFSKKINISEFENY